MSGLTSCAVNAVVPHPNMCNPVGYSGCTVFQGRIVLNPCAPIICPSGRTLVRDQCACPYGQFKAADDTCMCVLGSVMLDDGTCGLSRACILRFSRLRETEAERLARLSESDDQRYARLTAMIELAAANRTIRVEARAAKTTEATEREAAAMVERGAPESVVIKFAEDAATLAISVAEAEELDAVAVAARGAQLVAGLIDEDEDSDEICGTGLQA